MTQKLRVVIATLFVHLGIIVFAVTWIVNAPGTGVLASFGGLIACFVLSELVRDNVLEEMCVLGMFISLSTEAIVLTAYVWTFIDWRMDAFRLSLDVVGAAGVGVLGCVAFFYSFYEIEKRLTYLLRMYGRGPKI